MASILSAADTLDYEGIEIVMASRQDIFLLMRRNLRQHLDKTDTKLSIEVGKLIEGVMSGKMKQNTFINTFIICEVKNKVGPSHWAKILNSIQDFIHDKDMLPKKKTKGRLALMDS